MTNEEINEVMDNAEIGFKYVKITKTNGHKIEGTVKAYCRREDTGDGKSGICLLTPRKGGYYIPEDIIRDIEIVEKPE